MALLDDIDWQGKIYKAGTWVEAGGGLYRVVEPATGNTLGHVGIADLRDVDEAALAASQAQQEWAATCPSARAAILRLAGDLWERHKDEIRSWHMREVGAVAAMADFAIRVAAEECYEASALPSQSIGEVLPSNEPRVSLARRMPAGVVLVISPFNAPINLGIRSVAPALALGNSVILKPDPRSAVTGGTIIARIFEEAGLPPGVLQMLNGGREVGESLVTHPMVQVISFTGSTGVGRRIGEIAARHLKRVHLELGGNSALLVLDDADLDTAVNLAAWGSFFHQGQICMATGRHLVAANLFREYVDRLAEKASRLVVGDPTNHEVAVGPLIDESQRDKVHRTVTAARDLGATVAAGGTYDRLFYRPTVLADVPVESEAFREEIFGPVAPVIPFHSIEDAVSLASASDYGLSLGIITGDPLRGLAVAERVPSGIVHINDQTINKETNAPFGGVKSSGTGSRFGGAAANIHAFTEMRWITMRGEAPVYPF